MRLKFIFILSFYLTIFKAFPQEEPSKWELGGYISNMQSVMILDNEDNWINDNLFHNRINVFWYPSDKLSATIQLRNRFMYGQSIQMFDGYAESVDNENNYLDLSVNLFENKSGFLNTSIDRIYLQYSLDKFVLTVGRQRINWSQTFAWNPNDIFNVQNFFDFDYIEKPGSDAIRLQYYPNYSSTIEIAAKLDHNDKLSLAGYYKFNVHGYDFQLLSGVLSEEDLITGFGWSGDIKGAGFRGEIGYFHPFDNFKNADGILHACISADYTFSNSLNFQTEFLYSKLPEDFSINNFLEYYQGSLTVKNLSFSKFNYFGQISYPLTPLMNLSLSSMYFPDLKGFYIGPNMSYSLKDNSEISLISQVFSGKFQEDNSQNKIVFAFLRYKFSF